MTKDISMKQTIPWDSISSLGNLTSLIYDFMKYWDFKQIENLNSFLKSEVHNNELSGNDIELLKGLKTKYPQGEMLKFFTNSTDLQCAVCKSSSKKKFAIIFRGSESILDWIYDLMIWKTECKHDNRTFGSVHSGFYNQIMKDDFFNNLRNLVEEQIKECPDYEWELAGHSAGAAHSILTGFLLSQTFPNKNFVIASLAAPRVGDNKFTQLFEDATNLTHYRVCYNRDIVTSVPTIGYNHTGISLLYVENKWEIDSDYPFYIYRCWSISDHSVDKYTTALVSRCNKL